MVTLRRLGKRICIGLEEDFWLVLHLMIAGRLHWHDRAVKASRMRLAVFGFTSGTFSLTEAGTQRRASLHLIEGEADLQRLNPGGVEIFETDLESFAKVLQSANHTLKRALTDPRLFSGIRLRTLQVMTFLIPSRKPFFPAERPRIRSSISAAISAPREKRLRPVRKSA